MDYCNAVFVSGSSPTKWQGVPTDGDTEGQLCVGQHCTFSVAFCAISPIKSAPLGAYAKCPERPCAARHSPSALKGGEDKPIPQLSLESITGAGRCTNRNDAEFAYCADGELPDAATAPEGMRVRRFKALNWALGSFYPNSPHTKRHLCQSSTKQNIQYMGPWNWPQLHLNEKWAGR